MTSLYWIRAQASFLLQTIPNIVICWEGQLPGNTFNPLFRSVNDNVIKWNPLPRYWPSVRGIRRSPVNSPHKGQSCWVLMFSLICACTNDWVNNRDAGDLRRHRAHYDVTVMTNQHMWTRFALYFNAELGQSCLGVVKWRCFLPISFRITSLALGQSYECPYAGGITLTNMGNLSSKPISN